jgi:hypothetical protein
MKLLLLSVAGLFLATGGVAAAPDAQSQLFVAGVSAQADARLANAGVAVPAQTVKVRATLSGGRLSGVRVAQSSGDLATDRAVEATLRKMKVGQVPAALAGRDITLTLGPSPYVQAKNP